MISVELFLGFPCNPEYLSMYQEIPEAFAKVFVGENELGTNLQKITTETGVFLGKKIGKEADVERLKNLEENIYSILKRLTPDFPVKETSLMLFPVPCT